MFPHKCALLVSGSLIFALAGQTSAQTLDVGLSRTPTLSSVPSINLPRQQDNMVGQAYTRDQLTPPKIVSDAAPSVESTGTAETVTTEIIRDSNGQVTKRTGDNAPADKPVSQNANGNAYPVGMVIEGKARVYDGHSLVVDGHALRLNGIDAPGHDQTCFAPGGTSWRCGRAATAHLASLIDGRKVECTVEAPAGAGAAVKCASQGIEDVAALVVQSGFAVVNGHGKPYRAAQDEARRNKSGLWIGKFTNPVIWRQKNL